jgi:hypothetical protein
LFRFIGIPTFILSIMKTILFFLSFITVCFTVNAQCDYTLELLDDYDDGWSGNSIDVLVDGIVVLDHVTLPEFPNGSNRTIFFTVSTGSDITTIWHGTGTGYPGYEENCSYRILDYFGVEVASVNPIVDGNGNIPSGTVTGSCPSCANPTAILDMINSSSATAHWGATPGTSSYTWEVVPTGNQQGTGVITSGTTSNLSVLISGLTQATIYDYYIKSDCESVYAPPVTFTTSIGNDSCTDAFSINCGEVLSGSTTTATPETIGSYTGDNEFAKSVWYKFTGKDSDNPNATIGEPGDLVTLSTCNDQGTTPGNADFDTKIDIYSGNCGILTLVGGNDDGETCQDGTSSLTIVTVVEVEYFVRVYGYEFDDYGDFNLYMECDPAIPFPINNDFENATTLNVTSSCSNTLGTLNGATASRETPYPNCGDAIGYEPDVWYKFVAPSNGNIKIETTEGGGDEVDTVIALYSYNSGTDTLSQISCNDSNDGYNYYSSIYITNGSLIPGSTYYVRVQAYAGEGMLAFNICAYSPECPDVDNLMADNFTISGNAYISWEAVPLATGYIYEIQNIGVEQGTPGAIVSGTTTNISEIVNGSFIGGNSYTLYVQSSCAEGFGNFSSLDFDFNLPPANDDFENAEPLTVGNICNSTVGTLEGATASGVTPFAYCGSTDGTERDVWYSFIVPANGGVIVNIGSGPSNQYLDMVIAIYYYEAGTDTYTRVACKQDSKLILNNLIVGDTYYIQLHTYNDYEVSDFTICVYSPDCTGKITVWDGYSWSLGVPTSSDTAFIDDTYDTGIRGNIEACSLIISNNEALYINDNNYVRVLKDVIANGLLVVYNNGSLVQIDDASTFYRGTYSSMQVRKTSPIIGPSSFIILSSPMSDHPSNSVNPAIEIRDYQTENFIPNPIVATEFPLANNFADDNGNDWVLYPSNPLIPGAGYSAMNNSLPPTGGTITVFYTQGSMNNGIVNFETIFNGTQNGSPNVLGNPYPCAIDANLFVAENNSLIDALYFWEPTTLPSTSYPGYNVDTYDMGVISQYNASLEAGLPAANGGTTPTQYISSGRGFEIKALAAGTVTFNNSMRIVDHNDIYRAPDTDLLYINVFNDTYSLGSTALIGFTANATNGFDSGFDTARIATPVSIYSQLLTGEELGIQSRSAFNVNDEISLSFSSQVEEEQQFRISISDISGDNLNTSTVFLVDNENDVVTNLSETDYLFVSNNGNYTNKFTVLFINPTLGINQTTLDSILVYPNPAGNMVNIVTSNTVVTHVDILDISGRIVLEKDFDSVINYSLDVSKLKSAVYFIKIKTTNGSVTKQLIKK